MAARRHAISASPSRLSQLWQFPLLLFSLALFAYAAYLFFDPKPGLSADDQIDVGRILLAHDRPEAAREHLNRVLQNERLNVQQQGQLHLLLAQALSEEQKQKKLNVPANHERIIEQTRLATGRGAVLDVHGLSRLGESLEALGRYPDAIDAFRSAAALDPERSLRLQRRVIDLQQLADDRAGAHATLEQYLKDARLTDAEKAWAMGEQSHLLIEAGKFSEARALLDEAMRLELDPIARGALRYRMGYCAWKLGDSDEAERLLRVARDEFQARHPLDADACYVLGRIAQDRADAQQAASFYQVVLSSHPDARVAPLARMGRAICRIMLRQDEPALADLQQLVREIQTKPSRAKLKGEALEGLRLAAAALAARENYAGALETMGYEQELSPQPAPQFFARLGELYEKRADQIEKLAAVGPEAELIRRQQLAREAMTRAADAYVAYSRAQTIADDRSHGTAMWRGIELYDRAGNTPAVISTLELFVAERPDDPITPDALLRLGRAYQAAGQFDKAIAAFSRNTVRYPQSLAAIKSAVPLAEAYIAKGPESFGKAERVLLGVVTNNEMITPDSQEFRLALFDLGQLYHRTGRYEAAVGQLEEFHKRYPSDDRTGDVFFLMADSYRKSAARIEVLRQTDSGGDQVASASVSPALDGAGVSADALPVDPIEAERERRTRLERARELYDKVIERWRGKTPETDFDRLQLKLAYFYRADCVFDLGRHAEAIDLYEAATFKYQNDSMSLTALMQIVSAYVSMNKLDQARAAAERAKYLYRRMPDAAFSDGPYAQPRQYWEQQIKWMGEAGLW
jgi:tetratricopeptide (TPR) repeat protein